MTDIEAGAITDILKKAYPNFYKSYSDKKLIEISDFWEAMFTDEPLEMIAAALKAYIVTDEKGFPPSVGQIKNKIRELQNPGEMTEYEAWNLVKEAVSNGGDGYYNHTRGCYPHEAEFEKLPPILQRLIGSPNVLRDWYRMSDSTLESVVASNFMRSYRARAANEREYAMLPGDVKQFISALSDKMAPPEAAAYLTPEDINDRRNEIYRQLSEGAKT